MKVVRKIILGKQTILRTLREAFLKIMRIECNFWEQAHRNSSGFVCLFLCAYMVKTNLKSTDRRQEQYKRVTDDFSGIFENLKQSKVSVCYM